MKEQAGEDVFKGNDNINNNKSFICKAHLKTTKLKCSTFSNKTQYNKEDRMEQQSQNNFNISFKDAGRPESTEEF